MSTIDPGQKQVISHIDDAKNWLDEAKEEYLQSNRVRGELNLNLAQAEVKYAWELSRNQNVTQNSQPLALKRPKYYLPAVAASIVVLLGLTSMLYFGARPEKTGSSASTVKREINQAGETPVSQKQPELAKNEPIPASTVQGVETKQDTGPASVSAKDKLPSDKALKDSAPNPPVKIVKTEVVVTGKTSVPKKSLAPREKLASNPVTTHKVAPVSNVVKETRNPGENTIVLENVPEQEERESSGVQTSTKPAPISLVIDEEALTKEASYSLRNGK